MPKEYYILIKEVEGKDVYVSKEAPDTVVQDLREALLFFSLNHISVWRKCNPNVKDTIAAKVSVAGDYVNITKIK